MKAHIPSFVLVASLACLAALPEGVSGQRTPASLTLDVALAEALTNNPTLLSTRNQEALARADIRNSRGDLLPSATVSSSVSWQGQGEQRFGSVTLGQLGVQDQQSFYFSSYQLGLGFELDGSRILAPGRAQMAWDARQARVREGEDRVRLEVTRAYLEVLRQVEEVRLAQSETDRAQQNWRLVEAQRDVGLATDLEASQAQVGLGRSEVNQVRASAALHQATATLLALMGWDPTIPVELTTRFQLFPVAAAEDALLEMAMSGNPSLAAGRLEEDVASREVTMARTAYLPSVSVQASWSGFTRRAGSTQLLIDQANAQSQQQVEQCQWQNEIYSRLANPIPAQNCSLLRLSPDQQRGLAASNEAFPFDFTRQPPQALLSLSLPIFQGFTRSRRVEGARLELDNARLRIRDEELQLRRDITSGVTWARAAYQTASLEERNRNVAEQQLNLAREQFRVGAVDFLQLLEAEAVKARADREWLAAVFAFHDTLASLEAVVGAPIRSILGETP
ncbi:MAG: TolC family protein [Gemmatimonadota bacterium]